MKTKIIEDHIPFLYNEETRFGVYVCYDVEAILKNKDNCGLPRTLVNPIRLEDKSHIDLTHTDEVSILTILDGEVSIQILLDNDFTGPLSSVLYDDFNDDNLIEVDFPNKALLKYLTGVAAKIRYYRMQAVQYPSRRDKIFTKDCTINALGLL